MTGVGASIDSGRVASARGEIAALTGQVERTQRLLRIADPDG
jgi:hypothetical protein